MRPLPDMHHIAGVVDPPALLGTERVEGTATKVLAKLMLKSTQSHGIGGGAAKR